MSGSCGLYHFKRKKRIIGEKQKDRAHKPLKLFFFEGESFSPHLNVAWTRLSFRDACRTEGIAAWPPTVGTAGITQESGQRGAVYEGENENKVKKKQVHEVRWGELQMRLSGGGGTETDLQECHSSHTHADGCYLLRTASKNAPLWNGLL